MNQEDELDLLFLDSLKLFSEEFEARQKQITEQYSTCLNAFTEQSEALRAQYEQVSRQLGDSMERYEKVMASLKTLNATLAHTRPASRDSAL
jgi:ABC-type transporter Mla subunit MlaD